MDPRGWGRGPGHGPGGQKGRPEAERRLRPPVGPAGPLPGPAGQGGGGGRGEIRHRGQVPAQHQRGEPAGREGGGRGRPGCGPGPSFRKVWGGHSAAHAGPDSGPTGLEMAEGTAQVGVYTAPPDRPRGPLGAERPPSPVPATQTHLPVSCTRAVAGVRVPPALPARLWISRCCCLHVREEETEVQGGPGHTAG